MSLRSMAAFDAVLTTVDDRDYKRYFLHHRCGIDARNLPRGTKRFSVGSGILVTTDETRAYSIVGFQIEVVNPGDINYIGGGLYKTSCRAMARLIKKRER